MSPFTHILFTRYNIAIDVDDGSNLNPQWLEERAGLFEKYCLPSVAAQTCKDFVWVVLFDERIPFVYRQRIEQWCRRCEQLRPLFIPFGDTAFLHQQYIAAASACIMESGTLISSRLDSDDVLSADYIERVQQIVKSGEMKNGIISFPCGTQYFCRYNEKYTINYPDNHFITLVEPTDGALCTVMTFDHRYAADKAEVRQFPTDMPMWQQTVHGGNVANDFHRRLNPKPQRGNIKSHAVLAWLYVRHFFLILRDRL